MYHQKNFARRVWMSTVGVLVCGVGVGLFKYATFGVDPFQSFMGGMVECVPISFGLLYIIANLILLLFSLIFDRSKIGLATFINLFLLGYVADYSHRALLWFFPDPGLPARILVLILGLAVLSFSCSLYFTADLGVSTYDAVALVANQTWPRIPFRFCRVTTDLVCICLGVSLFLLSGQPVSRLGHVVGIGTIITACCMGPLIEFCNIHFSRPLLNRTARKQ